jgi:dephospho-CoA kinase
MAGTAKVVAITGGIGSGKSAVAELFQGLGAAIVDADVLAREVVLPGSSGLRDIQAAFPSELLLQSDGSLDRAKLGALIFADPAKRKAVEGILHPRIRALWLARLAELSQTRAPVIAYVVPLFFESKTPMPELQKIVLVTAPEQLRISRVVERDNLSPEAVLQRLRSQLPDAEKIPKSDYVIANDSTREVLREKVSQVFADLTRAA